MSRKKIIAAVCLAVCLTGCAAVGVIVNGTETPDYAVISSDNAIEIRRYPPMIVAEVEVSGERKEAIGDGFRLLADYIFGNNISKQDIAMTAPVQQRSSEKISMTAPVQQRSSEKISMTAPVQQQSNGDAWNISFVMPSEYTPETLPAPVNDRVKIKQVAAKHMIAITFSGTNSDDNIAEHEAELLAYIDYNHIEVIGTPTYAFYNPPWTLPFMRRNEVMVEIRE